jgi:hypothetical protein
MRLRQGGTRAQGRRNPVRARARNSLYLTCESCKIVELTGQRHVPLLLTDSGRAIHDSKRIIESIPELTVDS